MESQPQESSLIPNPRCGQHHALEVQEGLFQATPIGEVDPHHSHLLGHEEAAGAVPSMDHGHGVPQPVGHLGQAELQAALVVLSHRSQVAVELTVPQDIGEAVVLVGQVEEVAEASAIFCMGLLEAAVIGQQGDGSVAVVVESGAVVRAEAREVPEGGLRVLGIVEVGCVRRALLEEEQEAPPEFEQAKKRRNGLVGYRHSGGLLTNCC